MNFAAFGIIDENEAKLHMQLIELRKKRQQCLEAINKRNNEYSMNYMVGDEASFDTSTIFILENLDDQIQSYREQKVDKAEIINRAEAKSKEASEYLEKIKNQNNSIQLPPCSTLIESSAKLSNDKIPQFLKYYEKQVNENISLRNELNGLRSRFSNP